mmetsp:Transcript_36614/g.77262  ORF Transcript_36614/g.77262 Transcript_36614/m.77262 type:complete len:217 (+) Transcript_36614:1273-1923(+)
MRSCSSAHSAGSGSSAAGRSLPVTGLETSPNFDPQSISTGGTGRHWSESHAAIIGPSWHLAHSARSWSECFLRRCLCRKALSLKSLRQKWKEQRARPSSSRMPWFSIHSCLAVCSAASMLCAAASVCSSMRQDGPRSASTLTCSSALAILSLSRVTNISFATFTLFVSPSASAPSPSFSSAISASAPSSATPVPPAPLPFSSADFARISSASLNRK